MAAKKKPKKAQKAAPAREKPVPLNELYPDASRIPWVKAFLRKRSK
jgi:hypothetical protein